ncbi:MAG: hypothetical protein KatS3mg061_1968 [Dehalococcoidia bacterium]|nr:MAG: hypothetical protein KatS3mg061_1968 [Dehalococcoidia bacterium]
MADLAFRTRLHSLPAVIRLQESSEVLRLLREDRIGAAYLLGDLDSSGRPRGEWFLAPGEAIAALQRLGQGAHLWASGSPAGLAAIVRQLALPRELYLSGAPALLEILRSRYHCVAQEEMVRMVVRAASFRPVGTATRLGPEDTDQINRLYRLGAGGQVTRHQVAEGVYYGIVADGRLVAVAGTHFISLRERIGAVGNVFTPSCLPRAGLCDPSDQCRRPRSARPLP